MAKIALKACFLISLLTLTLIFPQKIFAESQITISTSPSSVEKLQEFNVEYSVSLESNQQYYVKVRIGENTSSLTKGETYNETTSTWLQDNSSWTSFPTITTNASGNFNSTIKARAKDSAQEGSNKLTVRVRKVGTSTNQDSDPADLQISASSSTSYPSNIYLSEFMPDPSEGQEWVEIYNDNDDTADLSGWKIDDIEGGSSPQHFNAQIPAKSYFVLYLDSAKLNNDGDSVRLIKPDESEVDKATYESSQDGVSWAKDGGEWKQTSTPTPGSANQITSTGETQESTSTPSPSPTTKSTPQPTQSSKKQKIQQSYQTDTPKYDWEQNENPTPEPSVINLVLGEETKKSSKRPPFAILFVLASLLFFTAAFYPQIKPKIQDFIEEKFQRSI